MFRGTERFGSSRIRDRAVKYIDNIEDLIRALDEGLAVRRSDIQKGSEILSQVMFVPPDEMRRELSQYAIGTQSYYEAQLRLIYEPIAGRRHELNFEGHDTVNFDAMTAFPFGGGPSDAAYWEICYAHLIQMASLSRGSRVLEIGFGAGGLAELMVRCGLDVTAVEVRQSNCDYLEQRVKSFGGTVDARAGEVEHMTFDKEFDAIVFYESFHHMPSPWGIVRQLRNHLSAEGVFIFGAEPICDDDDPVVPFPWGFRMDGGALSAIRDVGWVEFGFQRSYFLDNLTRLGFDTVHRALPGYHHASVWIAKQNVVNLLKSMKAERRSR
ncbi:class I SAM-dependent methyltransferase [Methylobacterium sp. WSM2598]|uniref:class I SAM-dependent methyltransferase n=1 Tax=Methylobacterium sp. WSM2598 TaxID=398261 RepID=UPI001F3F4AE0|nr:class I SAM-dependent methyltransferase [Methylobacterium sp. WSM2598]